MKQPRHKHSRDVTMLVLFFLGKQLLQPMIEENQQLITNDPVEVQDCRKLTDHFRGIYRIYLTLMKENRRMSTCHRLDLQTLDLNRLCPKHSPIIDSNYQDNSDMRIPADLTIPWRSIYKHYKTRWGHKQRVETSSLSINIIPTMFCKPSSKVMRLCCYFWDKKTSNHNNVKWYHDKPEIRTPNDLTNQRRTDITNTLQMQD